VQQQEAIAKEVQEHKHEVEEVEVRSDVSTWIAFLAFLSEHCRFWT
jgi:hypothetical protein